MERSTWETARDVDLMLGELDRANLDRARPTRLLACAFGRLSWDLLSDELGRPSVEIVERFIDGRASWADLRAEFLRIRRDTPPQRLRERAAYHASVEILMMFSISGHRAGRAAKHLREASPPGDQANLAEDQCDLIREIFGHPFPPEPFDPAWITPSAVDLARAIHDDRAFDRMPYLGDALEEAGCPSARILEHCRGPNDHVSGCWVVEALIGNRRPL
jgi:hypothetical protein